MAFVITAFDTVVPNPVAVIPPVSGGLEYLNFFNSADQIGRNLALGKSRAAVAGSPVQGANFVDFTAPGDYVDTLVAQPDDFTLIAVGEPQEETGFTHWVSSYVGGNVGQTSLYLADGTASDGLIRPQFAVATNNSGTITGTNSVVGTSQALVPQMIAGTYSSSTGLQKLYQPTHGLTNEATRNYPLEKGGTIRIGGSYSDAFINTSRLYAAAVYSTAMSEAQIATMYAWLQTRLAAQSITI